MDDNVVNFLLVDDDDVDVMAVRRAFKKARIANPIVVAGDGIEALEKLRGLDGNEPMPRPYLILLDLNMPRMNGIEFLQELRQDKDHQSAVVFVFTSSQDEEQKTAAYDYNIAGYIVKSRMSDDFLKIAEMLQMYWKLIELP